MASTREIRERIDSIQSTLKITNAMYMISSTKMNRARTELAQTEPYFYALRSMLGRVSRHLPEDFYHPYLDFHTEIPDEDRRTAIICVTADKGLAGSYNHNVLRLAESKIKSRSENNMLFVVGEVGRHYFEARNIQIDEQYHYTAQKPSMGRARKIAAQMLQLYHERKVDDVFIIYSTLVNGQANAEITQLLPLNRLSNVTSVSGLGIAQEDFNLFPSAERLLDSIIPDFIAGYVYSALVESFAAEHSARMQAMDAANKNGQELVSELQIRYNRQRQAQITQEITEVAAGAKARRQQIERRDAKRRAAKEAAAREAAEQEQRAANVQQAQTQT